MVSTNQESGRRPLTKTQAFCELTLAGALWGFGFVATIWSLQSFSPAETLFWRFVIATVFGLALSLSFWRKSPSWKLDLRLALPAGLILASLLLLQTIGLQHTTATKSGFLTCLYVIIVPIFHSIFKQKLPALKTWFWALTALLGPYFLVGAELKHLNQGDAWTVASAVGSAVHIIYIGKVSKKINSSFLFNNFQSLWCLLALTPLWLFTRTPPALETTALSMVGLLALGLGASLIAFALQVRSQKVLSDSTASMLFLLESPFAAVFGFFLLHERISAFQTFGALIIIAAAIGQILTESKKIH